MVTSQRLDRSRWRHKGRDTRMFYYANSGGVAGRIDPGSCGRCNVGWLWHQACAIGTLYPRDERPPFPLRGEINPVWRGSGALIDVFGGVHYDPGLCQSFNLAGLRDFSSQSHFSPHIFVGCVCRDYRFHTGFTPFRSQLLCLPPTKYGCHSYSWWLPVDVPFVRFLRIMHIVYCMKDTAVCQSNVFNCAAQLLQLLFHSLSI